MRSSLQLERRAVSSSGGELTYFVAGEGPAILLANGLGAAHQAYIPLIRHLSRRYRCLAWDYRGVWGAAPEGSRRCPSIDDHAADALAILRDAGADRAAIVGWSLGVQVALQLFADAPSRVAGLVLIAGGPTSGFRDASANDWLRRAAPRALDALARVPGTVERLLRAAGRSPEALTWARRVGLIGNGADPELLGEVARSFGSLDVRAALATLRDMGEHNLTEVLDAVDVPTLVIGGDRDPFTPRASLERMVQRIPGAEYLLLPGGTHYVLLDHAEHVCLRIDKFFAERGFGA